MKILLVDDERLARQHLNSLLHDAGAGRYRVVEAATADQALVLLKGANDEPFDILLLDIQMPGMNGVTFARFLKHLAEAPSIVFVTAYPEYASQAFDLEAADYLTKPVRLERLQQALKRAMLLRGIKHKQSVETQLDKEEQPYLLVNERGRTERVSLQDIVFCKAEQKYVTLKTYRKEHLYDGSLNELESKYQDIFLRIHRNALVARREVKGLEKISTKEDTESWFLFLHNSPERLSVSRRQLPLVRAVLRGRA